MRLIQPYRSRAIEGRGVVALHRLRAEKALGRPLPKGAIVHHADGSTDHDAPLVICQDTKYHSLLHARMRLVRLGVNPNTHSLCVECRQAKPREQFSPIAASALGLNRKCKACCADWQRVYRQTVKEQAAHV